jgi:hypothetical protein
MTELERALLELDVEWPATPDLATAVRARITAAPARRAPRRRFGLAGWRQRLAVAAAALVVLGGGTLAASPAARSTVWRWLGLKSVEIRREAPRATPVKPSRLGETLGLGIAITPAQARRDGARFPRSLGAPDAAYLGPRIGGQRGVALVYAPRAGLPPSNVTGVALVVQTFRASVDTPILEKMVGAGGRVERLTVAGGPAYWISGEPHGFQYTTPSGGEFVPQRLADHTLLVEYHGLLLRVEGRITRARAVAIARSALVQ